MIVNYKKKTILEEIDRVIKDDDQVNVIDYIELSSAEMEEFLYALQETGREYSEHRGFDEMYYTYKGIRVYEQR